MEHPPATTDADDLVGATLGHYRVVARLGRGGMGVVYRAEDARLGREVALKVLPASVAADPARRARMLREARSAAAVNHPGIATVHDVGEADGRIYIALELVEGVTLRARMREPLSADEAVGVARYVASALAKAHGKGIVHRDLKPENVMLPLEGGVKVLDFGLAKLRAPDPSPSQLGQQDTETLEGAVMGTPGYMSPEQAAGRAVDARTDVFALGVMLSEMMTGELPGLGGSGKPVGDARIKAIVARCLARDPAERWSDAGALLGALEGLTPRVTSPPPAAPRRWIFAVVGVALVGVVLALQVASRRAPAPAPDPSPTASAAPRATAVTDQPVPPSNVPEARSEYSAGLQALRDNSYALAARHFKRVTELDPTVAAAHLRVAMVLASESPELARAELGKAVALRAQLPQRDQALLDALEPVLGRTHKDLPLTGDRLETLTARYPLDVEILDWIGMVGAATEEQIVFAVQRATELDPMDGQAWQTRGNWALHLGRVDEARAAFERCASQAIDSTDCLEVLSVLEEREGRCEASERAARRYADVVRGDGLLALEVHAAGAGRPETTLRELFAQGLAALPQDDRTLAIARNESVLAQYFGRFDSAPALVDQVARSLAESTGASEYQAHEDLALARIHVALETGDAAAARGAARDFVAKSETWTRPQPFLGNGGLDLELLVTRIADLPGGIESARRRWVEERLHGRALPSLVWALGWAAPALTPAEAIAAIEALAADPRLSTPLAGQGALLAGVETADLYAGRAYLLAGRAAESLVYLRRAAGVCDDLSREFGRVESLVDLGRALEQTGDPKGACEAYAKVVAKWGDARPRSVSATAARDAGRRLGCTR